MSEKKSKESRKEEKKQSEVAFTILVNMHKNGDISVDQIPADPRIVVNVLTRATALATEFCINEAMKEKEKSLIHVPGMQGLH